MEVADGEPGWRPRDSPHAPERRVEVYQKRAEQRQNRREQHTRNGASGDRAVVAAGRDLHDRSLTRQRGVEELLRVPRVLVVRCPTDASRANFYRGRGGSHHSLMENWVWQWAADQ
jgi:hypothetical protein